LVISPSEKLLPLLFHFFMCNILDELNILNEFDFRPEYLQVSKLRTQV